MTYINRQSDNFQALVSFTLYLCWKLPCFEQMVDDSIFDWHAGANLQQKPDRPEFQDESKDHRRNFM